MHGFAESFGGSGMRKVIALGLMYCAVAGAAAGMGNFAGLAQDKFPQNAVLALDHGWEFRQVTAGTQDAESGWLPATVPGDVHLDLLANKKIADPFVRDNEAKLQWIEKESWEYRLNFDVDTGTASARQCGPGLRRAGCGRAGVCER